MRYFKGRERTFTFLIVRSNVVFVDDICLSPSPSISFSLSPPEPTWLPDIHAVVVARAGGASVTTASSRLRIVYVYTLCPVKLLPCIQDIL